MTLSVCLALMWACSSSRTATRHAGKCRTPWTAGKDKNERTWKGGSYVTHTFMSFNMTQSRDPSAIDI
jgi:hypothetical protein